MEDRPLGGCVQPRSYVPETVGASLDHMIEACEARARGTLEEMVEFGGGPRGSRGGVAGLHGLFGLERRIVRRQDHRAVSLEMSRSQETTLAVRINEHAALVVEAALVHSRRDGASCPLVGFKDPERPCVLTGERLEVGQVGEFDKRRPRGRRRSSVVRHRSGWTYVCGPIETKKSLRSR
jgi:hypothetical protein